MDFRPARERSMSKSQPSEPTLQIQQFTVSIDDPQTQLTAAWLRLRQSFARSTFAESATIELRIAVGADRMHPTHRQRLAHQCSTEVDGFAFEVGRQGSRRRFVAPHQGVVDCDIEAGWARLDCARAAPDRVKWFLLFRAVCEGLTAGGQCVVHAACLELPGRFGSQGVLLAAPSHTGKTTTALALAHSGWRLLGDDITYVRPPAHGSRIWGFPRACHVRSGTLKMLPWLAEYSLSPPDELGVRQLPLDELGGGGAASPWLDPALVVVLDRPNPRETRVEPLDRAGALSLLAAESLSAIPGVCDLDAGRDFVTLGRLVCATTLCRMSVGPNPLDAAEKLEQFWELNQKRQLLRAA
jgi:hypothetical protein